MGFIGLASHFAFAQQNPGESFLDKYFPIAQLFDSPIFFGIVVGSAVLLLVFTFIFLKYAKAQERKADAWSAGKSQETIVSLLSGADPAESRLAYIYIRHHCDEKGISLLLETLEDQRRRGTINPVLIYLLEELEAQDALPILQQIAKGKSSAAPSAQHAVDRLIALQEDEKSEPLKEMVK